MLTKPARSAHHLLVALMMTGCVGWQAVQLTPASFSPPRPAMRVTRLDGWQAVIASPRFEGDTIRGRRAEEPYDSIVMPASQVRSVAVPLREESEALTRIGVLAGFVTIFAAMMYVGGHASDS